MTRQRLYSRFLFIHRWFGLLAGFYFMLMGITGGFLVYTWTFESWIHPGLRRAASETADISLGKMINLAVHGLGATALPRSYFAPEDEALNVAMGFRLGETARTAFVDPSAALYRGDIDPKRTVSDIFFEFHHELFSGGTGKTIVAILGILLLVLLLSGLYLWWPKRRFLFRVLRFPKFRTSYQFIYDLHKLWGIYSLALMVMVTFSGIFLAKPEWFQAAEEEPSSGKKPPLVMPFEAVDFPSLEQGLKGHDVPSRPLRLNFQKDKIVIRTVFATGEERLLHYALATKTFEEVDLNAEPFEMEALQHDLHTGHYLGKIGSFLTFLAGLSTIFFFATGVWIWWGRPSRRRRKRVV